MADNGGWQLMENVDALAEARAAVMLDGRLFAAGRDGLLWRVTIDGDAVAAVEGMGESGWDTRLLAAAGDRLFAFEENGVLYAVEPATGEWERLDGDWSSVRAACGVGPTT